MCAAVAVSARGLPQPSQKLSVAGFSRPQLEQVSSADNERAHLLQKVASSRFSWPHDRQRECYLHQIGYLILQDVGGAVNASEWSHSTLVFFLVKHGV